MKKLSFKESRLKKFIAGKGFYAALAICVVGAGLASWLAVSETINQITGDGALSNSSSNYQSSGEWDYPAGKGENSLPITSSQSQSSSSSGLSSSAQSEESSTQTNTPVPQKVLYMLPLSGEINNLFSGTNLVKNQTYSDWRVHSGIDIKAKAGTQVKAVADGTVTKIYEDPLLGNVLELTHADKVTSVYCGLAKGITIKVGDKVEIGKVIGSIGSIPAEVLEAEHLHFAMRLESKWVDPLVVMEKTPTEKTPAE